MIFSYHTDIIAQFRCKFTAFFLITQEKNDFFMIYLRMCKKCSTFAAKSKLNRIYEQRH